MFAKHRCHWHIQLRCSHTFKDLKWPGVKAHQCLNFPIQPNLVNSKQYRFIWKQYLGCQKGWEWISFASQMQSQQVKWKVWLRRWENAKDLHLDWNWSSLEDQHRQLCSQIAGSLEGAGLWTSLPKDTILFKSFRKRWTGDSEGRIVSCKHSFAVASWPNLKTIHLSCLLHPDYNKQQAHRKRIPFFILAKSRSFLGCGVQKYKGEFSKKGLTNYYLQGGPLLCCHGVCYLDFIEINWNLLFAPSLLKEKRRNRRCDKARRLMFMQSLYESESVSLFCCIFDSEKHAISHPTDFFISLLAS